MKKNKYKKKILFCSESGDINSGYGKYTKAILSRLYDTNKYKIAELSSYKTVDTPNNYPWKVYPNAVNEKDERFAQYNANTTNQFGQWRLDLVLADFKPDIVIDFRDIFMSLFEGASVFREYFHWILAPTIDSFPIRTEWVDGLKNCDTLLTHTHWTKDQIESRYGIPVSGIVKDSIDTNTFLPKNKIALRNRFQLSPSSFIIGSVMRNQKRKLIPDLLKIIKKISENNKDTYLYLHTSYPEAMGWDIPDLLLEFDVQNNVLFTYRCNNCNHWEPSIWKGPQAVCPKCSQKKMVLANVSHGVTDQQLSDIYNMFDVYIQYAICEGFGIPPLEAASCGIPVVSIDHGSMKEVCNSVGGTSVPLSQIFREQENNSDRVYPDNQETIKIIQDIIDQPRFTLMELGELHREKVIENHSWDKTAKEFEKIIDNTKIINYHGRWSALSSNHFQKINKTMPDIESNRKYVNYIIDHVLEMPKLKESFFIQQLVMALDNGYILSEGKILPYGKEDATKILEVLFNNKKMLHQFLTDNTIIKQRDFLNYK
jgi:glycosyltransferase involved in cell wall biosynthesis